MHTTLLNPILTNSHLCANFNTNFNINFKPNFQQRNLVPKADIVSFSGQSQIEEITDTEKQLLFSAKKLNIQGIDKNETIDKLIFACTKFDKIGFGAEGSIYPIPFSNFVLKEYNDYAYSSKIKGATIEISDVDRLNGIEYKKDKYAIIDRIQGADLTKASRGKAMYEYGLIASSMPQSAYDDFLNKSCQIHTLGYCYDNLGKNIIVDYKNEKFMPFDLASIKDPFTIKGYNIDFSDEQFDGVKIDPIGCIVATIGTESKHPCYNNVLLKAIKSTVNDFDNFKMYDTSESFGYLRNKDKDTSPIASLFKDLEFIQEQKNTLSEQNLSNEEIKDILKEDIEIFNYNIDKLYDKSKDCPKEAFDTLNSIIDVKWQISPAGSPFAYNAQAYSDCNDLDSLSYKYITGYGAKYGLACKLKRYAQELNEKYKIKVNYN